MRTRCKKMKKRKANENFCTENEVHIHIPTCFHIKNARTHAFYTCFQTSLFLSSQTSLHAHTHRHFSTRIQLSRTTSYFSDWVEKFDFACPFDHIPTDPTCSFLSSNPEKCVHVNFDVVVVYFIFISSSSNQLISSFYENRQL